MQGTLLTQHQADEILTPHLATIKGIMVESLEDLNKALSLLPEVVNKRSRSSLLHSISIEKAKRYFKDVEGVSIKSKYQSIQIIFSNSLVCRIKKVDKNNISCNAKTSRNDMILSQQLRLFLEQPAITFADLGYEMDSTWAMYKRHVVVCRLNDSVKWFIDFSEIASSVVPFNINEVEVNVKEEKQIIIKRKAE